MKEFIISASDDGRRLDKFIMHILGEAPSSFAYKMLRKKNIKLNGLRATGSELLREGDEVALYFREETFAEFRKEHDEIAAVNEHPEKQRQAERNGGPAGKSKFLSSWIIY